ncbi:hypothetical protein MPLSOD_90066 [Mesorhizobium sp. SOD10]|nr:hypothetical protein MPLSOD_90066 [Mesorhizobium sp. SOD10]
MPLLLTPSQTARKLECFGRLAERACDSGFHPIPMNGKMPMIKGWNSRPFGKRAIANLLARSPETAGANVGFRTGHLVAIDIDHEVFAISQRIAYVVRGALGDTPFVRVGRWPRQMLFYRSPEPTASTSLGKVDILGAGKIATVAGIHPDTGTPYYWLEDSLLDVTFSQVPLINAQQVQKLVRWLKDDEETYKQATTQELFRVATATASLLVSARARRRIPSGPVVEGERNNTLFLRLLEPARATRSYAALLAIADRENASFLPPMRDEEVDRVAKSVWDYRQAGRLLVKGRQATVLPIDKDGILNLKPDAFYLLAVLKTTRAKKTFEIPQKATAARLGWGSDRVKKAIDGLLAAGYIRIASRQMRNSTSTLGRQVRALIEYEWGLF